MRSPKSVRRPHIRQQLTNRRKNLGRVAKSQRNQFRQWLLTAVLPNSINDKRQEAFASLELTEQPQKVEKVKKVEKKKVPKQTTKDHEAEQKLNAKKAAEKEARRAETEAKKRAAQEEEDKKWKAEQEQIKKEQEKKEADLKKLQAEKKKEKAAKAEKAKKAEKAEKAEKAAPAPVEEEIVVKKTAKVEQAAAPEPKTPTNTPAEPAEQNQEAAGKKNKKNKKKSESEQAHVEQVVEQPAVVSEEPQQQAAPQEKKDKKKSESEKAPAAPAPAPVEQVVEKVEEPVATAPVSKKPTADSMDFLDFVTAKPEKSNDSVEEHIEAPKIVEPVHAENESAGAKKKNNKKNKSKKNSESEAQPPAAEPVKESSAPEVVEEVFEKKTVTPSTGAASSTPAQPPASKNNKKNKNKKNSESEPQAPAAEPVKEVTPEVVEEVFEKKIVSPTTETATPAPSQAPASKNKNKNKNKKHSESETQSPAAPIAEPVKESAPEVVEEVFEKKYVAPSTENSAPASKKNKKNKKGSGHSESNEAAPAPTVEIPQTTVNGGKGSPGSDKENSGSTVNGSAKKQTSVEELDYGVPSQTTDVSGDKKNKKKNKKGKNSNSISENATVIAHLEQDHLDQLADDEVQAITGAAGSNSPPIQVHEVTSSEQHANGTTIEKNTTIEITQALDGTDMSQTQFQKNVERLVQATLAKHDIVEIDPTVKLRIDAQLIKLSEKKAPAVVMEHVNYIKPMPIELHISRPSTPSRDRVYKLLPKDIIFCAGLIDTHGENYAAMASDERNIFKDTSRALQRKIRIFKESPHYQTYLRAKEESRPIEEVIAAEAH